MIIQCQSCSRKFIVKDSDIPAKGRTVQCGYCSVTWHQNPISAVSKVDKKSKKTKGDVKVKIDKISKIDEDSSPESIKASDGKTYQFLGGQWAQLMPSGKTGIFAKKKISQELNKITGRKDKKTIKKRKKIISEVNPSSINSYSGEQLPKIYEPKHGLGILGYIFLFIIIGFSIVGVLKTFENDLLNAFPEIDYIYQFLDVQLEFFAETFKNMVVIVKDLLSSY